MAQHNIPTPFAAQQQQAPPPQLDVLSPADSRPAQTREQSGYHEAIPVAQKPEPEGGMGTQFLKDIQEDSNWLHWAKTLFARKGRALPQVPMWTYMIFSIGVCLCFSTLGLSKTHNPATYVNLPTSLLSLGVSMLMSFRMNSCYGRWWEGRKHWDTICNTCIDMGRQSLLGVDDKEWHSKVIRWVIAWAIVTKQDLRNERDVNELRHLLSEEDLAQIQQSPIMPLYVARRITDFGVEISYRSAMALNVYRSLDHGLTALTGAWIACQRIRDTPMPFAYVAHLRAYVMLWLAAMPFLFVNSLSWFALVICGLFAYKLLGFEGTGLEIENPFGRDYNDLPVGNITQRIQNILLETLNNDLAGTYDTVGRKPLTALKQGSVAGAQSRRAGGKGVSNWQKFS